MKRIPKLIVAAVTLLRLLSIVSTGAAAGEPLRVGEPPLPILAQLEHFTGARVLYSPDDRLLLTEYDGNARIWDAKSFKPIGKPIRRGLLIDEIYFVADGAVVFVSSKPAENENRRAQYFDANSGTPIGPDFDLGEGGHFAASSGNGKYLAESVDHPHTKDSAGEIKVLERSTSRVVFSRKFPRFIEGIWLNRDGSELMYEEDVTAQDVATHLVRLSDGKPLFEDALSVTGLEYFHVDFSPDAKSVAIGDRKGFKIFELATEKMTFDSPSLDMVVKPDAPLFISVVKFSDDGTLLRVWRRGVLRRWDIAAGGDALPVFRVTNRVESYAISRDCKRMSCWFNTLKEGGQPSGWFAVMDLDTGKALWEWHRPSANTSYTALTGDGRHVAISDWETGFVYIVDLNDLSRPAPK